MVNIGKMTQFSQKKMFKMKKFGKDFQDEKSIGCAMKD